MALLFLCLLVPTSGCRDVAIPLPSETKAQIESGEVEIAVNCATDEDCKDGYECREHDHDPDQMVCLPALPEPDVAEPEPDADAEVSEPDAEVVEPEPEVVEPEPPAGPPVLTTPQVGGARVRGTSGGVLLDAVLSGGPAANPTKGGVAAGGP